MTSSPCTQYVDLILGWDAEVHRTCSSKFEIEEGVRVLYVGDDDACEAIVEALTCTVS